MDPPPHLSRQVLVSFEIPPRFLKLIHLIKKYWHQYLSIRKLNTSKCVTRFLLIVDRKPQHLILHHLSRFLLIVYRKLYHDILNRKNTLLMILAVWMYAVVIAALPLVGWNYYMFKGNTCSIADVEHPYFRTFFFMVCRMSYS